MPIRLMYFHEKVSTLFVALIIFCAGVGAGCLLRPGALAPKIAESAPSVFEESGYTQGAEMVLTEIPNWSAVFIFRLKTQNARAVRNV